MKWSIHKNLKQILYLFIASLMALTLVSCGGGSGGEAVTMITGQFVDDPVQGLDYSCSSGSSGVTDVDGQYVCAAGDTVTFSVGSVVLGSVLVQQAAITPYSLFPNNVDAAINVARLLQTLDADGDTGNGVIQINSALVSLLPASVDFESPTFASDVETVLGSPLTGFLDALNQLNEAIISPGNHSPIADAGPDQTLVAGSTATLNGSASADPDGDALSYQWSLVSIPTGSTAVLQNASSVEAMFDSDLAGEYILNLVVFDGLVAHLDSVVVTATASDNPNLSSLDLAQAALSPAFVAATTSYTAIVGYAVDSITLTATAADSGATISLSGFELTSGSPYTPAGSLAVGPNPFNLVVTAADSVTSKTYSLTVTREAASSNADLSSLVLAGSAISPAFDAGTTSYTTTVANAVETVTITPTVADAGATISIVGFQIASGSAYMSNALAVGDNSFPFAVTAADGLTSKTYTLTVTREAASSNANLSGLVLAGRAISPAFDADTTSYTATVGHDVDTVTVTLTLDDAGATISLSGLPVPSGSPYSPAGTLAVGSNPLNFIVTAADGSTKTYTLTVTREAASSNADLSSLVLAGSAISPAFDAATTSYTATVGHDVDTVTVTLTVDDAGATVSLSGQPVPSGSPYTPVGTLAVGPNPLNFIVTAADGSAKTYTLTVTREAASSNADLSSLVLAGSAISPAFDATTTSYTATVGHDVDTVTVTLTVDDAGATVSLSGQPVPSGSPYTPVGTLAVGLNQLNFIVKAADGVTTKTYTLNVTREAALSNADLSGLVLAESTLSPVFDAATTSYSATVGNAIESVSVTATTADAEASIAHSGFTFISGNSYTLPILGATLQVGPNEFLLLVTAADGVTTKTYTLTVTREAAQQTTVPGQPQDFQIVPGDTQLTLSWSAVADADSYKITWKEDGVAGWNNIPVAGGTTQYIHTGLTNGTSYTYFVEAINTVGYGPATAQLSAIPAIPVPQNLVATAGAGQTLLSWDTTGASAYTVYWNTTGTVTTADNSIDAGTNLQITHSGLRAGENYFYRVSASGSSGESELSAEISSTQMSNWQWANPKPHGNTFNKIVWGNNQFIAVTNGGGIYTSADASDWVTQNSGTAKNLWDIAWSGSRYVAVGDDGAIITSTDGITWMVRSPGSTSDGGAWGGFGDVVWNGSQFVIAGAYILTSSDGIIWAEQQTSATFFLENLSWNGSLFVAFESGATKYTHTSPDGITWTQHATILNNLVDIVWDGSHFIAPSYGAVYSSTDGVDWIDLGDPFVNLIGGSIIWDGNQFVGAGQTGLIATSVDGLNWTVQTSTTSETLFSIASSGSQYVAVGSGGLTLTSANAINWSKQLPLTDIASEILNDVVWNGSLFVAVGYNGVIVTSLDGDNWTLQDSGTTNTLNAIIWNVSQSQFVAVGGGIFTSPDGVNWTSRDLGVSGLGITWSDSQSQYVVVGGYKVVHTSPDGINWTSHDISSTVAFKAVSWNGTRYVAAGGSSAGYNVMTSDNGTSWTGSTTVYPRIDDMIWANGRFLAAAATGRMLTSPDGLTWTTNYVQGTSAYMIYVGWDGSQYVSTNADGSVYISPDGGDWTVQNTGSGNWIESITWNDAGKAVAVGLFGQILTNSSW